MKKRAQLAVETLLIYGVAILIVMVAIGALVATGVLNPIEMLPNECKIGNELTCENYVVTPTGVQLELRNSYGKNIKNITVTLLEEGNNEGIWNCLPGKYDDAITNGEISSPIFLPCDIKVHVGKKIEGKLSVKFNPIGSQINRTVTGTIRASISG